MIRRGEIYKYSKNRKVIATFPNISEAAKSEGVPLRRMKRAVDNHIRLNNSIFSTSQIYPAVLDQKWANILSEVKKTGIFFNKKIQAPWEGVDGNFDIDGWAEVCYYNI